MNEQSKCITGNHTIADLSTDSTSLANYRAAFSSSPTAEFPSDDDSNETSKQLLLASTEMLRQPFFFFFIIME